MADILTIDYETASAAELKHTGQEAYAAHPSTRVWCAAFKFDNEPTWLWKRSDPLDRLDDVFKHIRDGKPVGAHNAGFELAITKTLHRQTNGRWPLLSLEQIDCTMARARAMALPGGLDGACEALRLPIRKDATGYKSMMKLAKPRRKEPLEFWSEETAPEDFERLYAYCPIDVDAGYQLHCALAPLQPFERRIWIINQTVNERGVQIDVPSAHAAALLLQTEKRELSQKVHELTGGASTATTRDKLLAWLKWEGVEISGLRKGDVAAILADPEKLAGNDAAKAVLEIRKEASKSSTTKLQAMLRGVGTDDRARGLYQFHGANTGRFAGARIQTQNLPRPPKHFKYANAIDVIDWLRFPNAAACIRHEYGSAMEAISASLRSFIVAAPGKRFVSADYSNIEGRVLAWLAGEEWKLDAFRDFDAGQGADLYKLAYSKSFGADVDSVDDDQRQIGKVQELALGFQGGIGSFLSMGANYGVVPEKIADAVKAAIAESVWNKAAKKLPKETSRFRYNLDPFVWTGLRCVIDGWREAHPRVKSFWRDLNDAACEACENPGMVCDAGPLIRYRKVGDFLLCKLPSGRCLYYPYAEVKPFPSVEWEERKLELEGALETLVKARDGGAVNASEIHLAEVELKEHLENVKFEGSLTYWGVSSKAGSSKKFRQLRAYGGLLAENCTQATARDCFVAAWPALEAAGYPLVMHTHDEDVCEPDEEHGSVEEMVRLMCALPDWAYGLPVTAAGWEGSRYKK